jgi:hypothetical protein
VGSCVKSKTFWLEVPDGRLSLDGAGDRGNIGASGEKTGVDGIRTGKAVEGSGGGDDANADGGGGALDWPGQGGGGKTVGRPAVVPWV